MTLRSKNIRTWRHAGIAAAFAAGGLFLTGCVTFAGVQSNLAEGGHGGEACTETDDFSCADHLTLGRTDPEPGASPQYVTFFRSFDLGTPRPEVTRAVIVIHGFRRNPASTFERLNDVMSDFDHDDDTVVIAPWFKTKRDRPNAGELYWTENSWSKGDDGLAPTGDVKLYASSFDAVDGLIDRMLQSGAFPALKTVIVAGLSAGGQFTQRYAAGSLVEAKYPAVHFRYIVAAPSSYLYLSDQRKSALGDGGFSSPVATSCDYDSYRYGLASRNRYMDRISSEMLRWQYLGRDVVYLVGDGDDAAVALAAAPGVSDPRDAADLDVTCAAKLQGDSRLDRQLIYSQYLDQHFRGHQHHHTIIAGVAHQLAIFASDSGAAWLFENGPATPASNIVVAH